MEEQTRHARSEGRGSYRKGLGLGAAGFVSAAAIALITSLATARLYGARVIGEFALAYAPTGAVWFLSSVREAPALIRALAPFAPRAPRVTGLFAAVFAFSSCLTLAVSCLAVGVSYLVFNGPIHHPSLFLPAVVSLACYFVIVNSCWNIDTVLAGFRAAEPLFWVRLHQVCLNLVFIVGASFVSTSIWSLLVAQNLSWLTSLVHRSVAIRRYVRWPVARSEIRAGFRALPDIIGFGLRLTPGAIAYGVSNECGTWILGAVSPLATVGAYNRASGLAQRFLEVNYRLTEMLLPTLVERRQRGDSAGFDVALVDSLRHIGTALMWPAAVGGGAALGIMQLFGSGFVRAATPLAILLAVPAVTTMSQMQVNALIAVDRPVVTTGLAIVRTIVTVGLAVPLGVNDGATGVAIALLAGTVVQFVLQLRLTAQLLARPFLEYWPPRQMGALAIACVLSFLGAHAVYAELATPGGLVLALAAGSAVFIAIVLLLGGILPRDRARLAELRRYASAKRLAFATTDRGGL
jgi:O-antigen/teichoic acid export membrane protein